MALYPAFRTRPRRPALALRLILGLVALAAGLGACSRPDDSLAKLQGSGVLRVATTFGPLSYYLGAEGPEGIDYELARDFATRLGLRLQVTAYPDRDAMQAALRNNQADLAAAHLTFDTGWSPDGQGTLPCYSMPQVFVGVRGRTRAKQLADLAGLKLLVHERSPQLHRAEELRADIKTLQIIQAGLTPGKEWPDLLMDGIGDIALVDAAEFALVRNNQVRLIDAFGDTEERPVQWIVRTGATSLIQAIDRFCAGVDGASLVARAMQRTMPVERRTRRVPAAEFRTLQVTRLPQLLPYFQEAAAATQLDWRLLAALGYQESQWDPTAVSPNGAQGLMMLMPATSRSLGVTDPMEARGSIVGGARYLAEQMRRLPARIKDPERTLFALAVYNIGLGHLEDARILTQQNGGNPDLWADVKRHLPLLEQQYWYARAENGYARGGETVGLVDNVRQYWTLLADYVPPPAPTLTDPDSGAAIGGLATPTVPEDPLALQPEKPATDTVKTP
jgi:membrane-bound lytic murein transglycosylase F